MRMSSRSSASALEFSAAPGFPVSDAATVRELLPARSGSTAKIKATEAWQQTAWERWPREECWPAKMDVYEAAAYLRVSPDTVRRAVVVARDGKARLAHQRLGSIYRIRKVDLDSFGVIPGRAAGF